MHLSMDWFLVHKNSKFLCTFTPIILFFIMIEGTLLSTSCKELTHWKGLWCWEGLGAGGEGDNRGWDGWASPTRWTWLWVKSGSWWWTGRPGVLQFMGLQRVRHDWVTELNWTEGDHELKQLHNLCTRYWIEVNVVSQLCLRRLEEASPQLRNKGKSGQFGNQSKQGGWKNRTYMDSNSNRGL